MERGEQGFLEDSDHPFHCLDYREYLQKAAKVAYFVLMVGDSTTEHPVRR